jgi:hypothetical protein
MALRFLSVLLFCAVTTALAGSAAALSTTVRITGVETGQVDLAQQLRSGLTLNGAALELSSARGACVASKQFFGSTICTRYADAPPTARTQP